MYVVYRKREETEDERGRGRRDVSAIDAAWIKQRGERGERD